MWSTSTHGKGYFWGSMPVSCNISTSTCTTHDISTISQKPMQPGWPNLKRKCSTMSPGNVFILGSEAQGHESRRSIVGVGLCTLVSAGFFRLWFVTSFVCCVAKKGSSSTAAIHRSSSFDALSSTYYLSGTWPRTGVSRGRSSSSTSESISDAPPQVCCLLVTCVYLVIR